MLTALKTMHAFGRARVRPQAEVAREARVPVRALQQATFRLNERGEPVVSTCKPPCGIYIAETYAEIEQYERQLTNRIRGNAIRLRPVRAIKRSWLAQEKVEPSGQGRLFA